MLERLPRCTFSGYASPPRKTSLLDQFRTANDLPDRSAAVRALLRSAGGAPAPGVELPATLRAELEEVVEEGYARDLEGAVATVLTLGLGELARTHTERMTAMRDRARSLSERKRDRRSGGPRGSGTPRA